MLQHLTNAAFPVWSHILFLAGAVFNFSGSLLLWSSRVVGLKTSEVWSWYTCRVQMCPVFEILKPPRRFTIYSNLLVLLLNLRRAKWKNPAGTLPWLSVDTINIAHKHWTHFSTIWELWAVHYEGRTSATDCRLRANLSWLTPWWTGLPYVAPLGTGRLRPPRRTRTL